MFTAFIIVTALPRVADAANAAVTSRTPNTAKLLAFRDWMSSCDRYERMEHITPLRAGSSQVKLYTCNMQTGGTAVPFGADTTLTLTLDGTPVATAAIKAADTAVTFNVDLSTLGEGWYMASVTGLDTSWSVLDYGLYVLKGTTAQPASRMPVVTASHEMVFEGAGVFQTAWVPAKFDPIVVPYPARDFPDLTTIPARKDVVITSLAVPRPGDLYRPATTAAGVWTTANRENYFYFDFEQPKPMLPMLDGPRGRGSIIAPVHLEVGNAAPNGTLRGNVYFVEAWRVGKVTPDGTVVTLAGYRHKDLPSYWADPTSAELIGDWSSIPAARRGFAQPWGMAWDARTLVINEATVPIPSENNEKPHILGPVMYISDTFRNRVLKLQFSATAHGVPPVVTEFATGLNQPWDVIAVGTRLYVSDRMNNAIKVFDMDTAALEKTINVVQPEGMAVLDGWLYYGSVKSKSIRKIELATGTDVLIADPSTAGSQLGYYINNNSRYMKIAVSDGSFGPRGMIAYTTWSNSYYGYPNLIDGSTGKMIDWIAANGATVKGTTPLGLSSYASAVGIGHGRMLWGTAEEGLHVVSKALATDPVIDSTKYKAGMSQWQARGYGLTHGPAGYGYYGNPLPWGETPEIDYFLSANLHAPAKLGNATIAANPYGPLSVQGATLSGTSITGAQDSVVIQLGNQPGNAGSYVELDVQGLALGTGKSLTLRSGAAGQSVVLFDSSAIPSNVDGTITAEGANGTDAPSIYLHGPNGIRIGSGGKVIATAGATLDALGTNATTGQAIVNRGTVDGGPSLELRGAAINGGGTFKGNAVTIRTFGNANNPANGAWYLANGLQVSPSTGNGVALTLGGYAKSPQVLNVSVSGNATLEMPSAWPSGTPWPSNNGVVLPGAVRAANVADPAYGGGSLIVQASGNLTLTGGGLGNLVFPGSVVLKAGGTLDTAGVGIDNTWTTTGKPFQGVFLEAPTITSSASPITVVTNDQNWVNFSVRPNAPVRSFLLTRNTAGAATPTAADAVAPHLNTYSTLIDAAASGKCWTCIVNPTPVGLY
ncbi:MAG: hypothetical protein U1F10_02450 [Burkholderiales bacterium]